MSKDRWARAGVVSGDIKVGEMGINILGDSILPIALDTADDIWLVPEGVTIATDDDALDGEDTIGNKTVIVEGTVIADNAIADGIALGYSVNGGNNRIVVTDTGFVFGQDNAIQHVGGNMTLRNDGLLMSQVGDAVFLAGNNNRVVNGGTISALTNQTGIDSTGGALELVNHGVIEGEDHGVRVAGTDNLLENHGRIEAQENGWAIHAQNQGNNSVLNTGTMIGGKGGFLGSPWADSVTNSGAIYGDVTLGGGHDTYDGLGGKLVGEVSGGNGDDLFIIDDPLIKLREEIDQGTDRVMIAATYTLGDNFEVLSLMGSGDFGGIGNELGNLIDGNTGANTLSGRDGEDTIYGHAGDDFIRAGGKKDRVYGGEGDDDIRLGSGGDTAEGGDGDDRIQGRSGRDKLEGNAGNDTLIGGDDEDRILGGSDDDLLRGGAGADSMTGGDGMDVFDFNAMSDSTSEKYDRITDFKSGQDLLDVTDLVPGQFDLNIGGSFTGGAVASIRTVESGGDTRVNIDIDGDGSRDMRIDLQGVTGIVATDFLL
jgi:hypothetical protein